VKDLQDDTFKELTNIIMEDVLFGILHFLLGIALITGGAVLHHYIYSISWKITISVIIIADLVFAALIIKFFSV
jgi:hypothetical protein